MVVKMSDREIADAAMRWATTNAHRLEIGAEKRRASNATDNNYRSRAWLNANAKLTPARRSELAALRALAKLCAKERSQPIDDVGMVVDAVEVLRLRLAEACGFRTVCEITNTSEKGHLKTKRGAT